jgi:hypothetical protein
MAKSKAVVPVDQDAADVQPQTTLNKKYEEWKVKPVYEQQRGKDGSMCNVCTGFEKDAQKPIRVTNITPDKADILNSQSENTGVHLFLVEAE